MNILFLMADELRFDVLGFMGNPIVRTPNLDRLAKNAVVFDRAYSPSPVCVPARQCLATGNYPQRAGCLHFGQDIPPNSPTFARHFTEHGYYTVACGKLHHRGPDQMQGWMHRIGSETAVDWPPAYASRSQVGRRKWRGAEDVLMAGPGVSPLGIHDDYTMQGACDFVRMYFGGLSAIPAETPLLLMVSLQQPHFPLLADQELFDYYLDRVPVFEDQPRSPIYPAGCLGAEEGVTPEAIRRATAAYYAMVEKTDQRIGRVLDELERQGQNIAEWTIVFTADHGEMLGQHGLWEKRKFYEGSVRVPFFISSPSLTPRRENTLCNLVDIFPTLAALTGLPAPSDIDGRDLFSGHDPDETFSQLGTDHFMARSGPWKYLLLADGSEALFHLERDRGETTNFITDEASIPMREKLNRFLTSQAQGRV